MFKKTIQRHGPRPIPIHWYHFLPPVFQIRPNPKLSGLKDPDPDPKLLISDRDPAPDPDPPLFHTKLKMF
jgi:hypothetical protein